MKYYDMLKKIKIHNSDLIKYYKTPNYLMGTINNWIGYSSDINKRKHIITDTLKKLNDIFIKNDLNKDTIKMISKGISNNLNEQLEYFDMSEIEYAMFESKIIKHIRDNVEIWIDDYINKRKISNSEIYFGNNKVYINYNVLSNSFKKIYSNKLKTSANLKKEYIEELRENFRKEGIDPNNICFDLKKKKELDNYIASNKKFTNTQKYEQGLDLIQKYENTSDIEKKKEILNQIKLNYEMFIKSAEESIEENKTKGV